MRQLKFHCHQHTSDIGYLTLFQADSTTKASSGGKEQHYLRGLLLQLHSVISSKLAGSLFPNPCSFTFQQMLSSVLWLNLCVWTSSLLPPDQVSPAQCWQGTTQHPCPTSDTITKWITAHWRHFHPAVSKQTTAHCTTLLRSSVSWNNYLSNYFTPDRGKPNNPGSLGQATGL